MNYQPKYNTVQAKYPHTRPPGTNGVHAIPEYYTEQGIIDQDIKYGWMKHKAQANYRSEEHSITLEEWRNIWTLELWFLRGRGADDMCVMRDDLELGWAVDNVVMLTRKEQLKRAIEYRNTI